MSRFDFRSWVPVSDRLGQLPIVSVGTGDLKGGDGRQFSSTIKKVQQYD